jgi:flagellar hook-associated protein 3 FlgL
MVTTISAANSEFLANLSNVNSRIVRYQQEVSSGLALQNVSDNPDQVSAVLQLKARIANNNQIGYNLGEVTTEVNAAENALETAVNLMNKATQLATQGSSSLTGSTTDQQLAVQVKDIISEMLGLTQTQAQGRYVFSGNSDQTPPYAAVDLTQANGVGAYQGSTATRTVQHPNGSAFAGSLTAVQIFDSGGPSTTVLQALTGLYNALNSGNSTAISAANSNITSSNAYLNGQLAQYGDFQNEVANATSFQSDLNVQLQAQIGVLQDADEATVITQMQENTTVQTAALESHAALPNKSLFDFIG